MESIENDFEQIQSICRNFRLHPLGGHTLFVRREKFI